MATVETADARAMFARLFTACFHGRQSAPSFKPYSPAEGSSETDSGASFSHPSSHPNPPQNGEREPSGTNQPEPHFSALLSSHQTNHADMPKAQRVSKKDKAKQPAKPPDKPKAKSARSKAKYFSSYDGGAGASAEEEARQKLDELFTNLQSDDDREPDGGNGTLGAESLEGYTQLLGVNGESYEVFILLDTVQAEGIGQLTRKGFVEGWKQAWLEGDKKGELDIAWQKKYIRQRTEQARRDPAYWKKLYLRAFLVGKEPEQKALDTAVAVVFWDMLFHPAVHPWKTKHVDWLDAWKAFLEAKWKRSVNKDMWSQTQVFAGKTMEDETLGFWSEDQAWPSVIDDFVAWCRETGVVLAKGGAETMEVDE